MAANSFGEILCITTFGESHGPGLGVVIDGLPAGLRIDLEGVQRELDRRRPGTTSLCSARQERDRLEVLAGLWEGATTGAPVAFYIRNEDTRPADYDALREVFRPGHADYSWWKKYGVRDHRGGGRSSGRETVARVAAGAVAKQLLKGLGVSLVGHVVQVGTVCAKRFDPAVVDQNPLRCADADAALEMEEEIERAKASSDSLGSVVEIRGEGVPAGWGDPVFDKLEARLGAAILSIGAVKGIEFGEGFLLAGRRGSESNDPLLPGGGGSNHQGGILGGISTGEPLVFRLAVKPTPSIGLRQSTIDTQNRACEIAIEGRHDPCLGPRLVPVAEAMTALVLCDAYLRQRVVANQG